MHIELRAVSKCYGQVRALDRVSAEIAPGQIVSVLGANGAGKTTLLKVLYGITSPESGELLLDGEPFTRDRLDLRRRMACLPDFPLLFPGRTIVQNIAIHLNLYQANRDGTEAWVIEAKKADAESFLADQAVPSDPNDAFYVDNAKAWGKLKAVFDANISDVTLVRVGPRDDRKPNEMATDQGAYEYLLVGKTADGKLAGVTFESVET